MPIWVFALVRWTLLLAVVPVTGKSRGFTFVTASLNVTHQVRLSALVGELERHT